MSTDRQVIEVVRRASGRSAAVVHQEMKRGLSGLATIASTAPFLGLLATVLTIPNSFRGCVGERSACMAAGFEGLANSLMPIALCLLVAVPAFCCYKYLRSEIDAFDVEMQNITLELTDYLVPHLRRLNPGFTGR